MNRPAAVALMLVFVLVPVVLPACGGGDEECAELVPTLPVRAAPEAHDPASFDRELRPLGSIPVPTPTGGNVVDGPAAIRLGKAFFWDLQAGSDGQTACASCHFHAGADNRRIDSLNPGVDGAFGTSTASSRSWNGKSFDTDDAVGSQGVIRAVFQGLDPTGVADVCEARPGPPFEQERQVTPRNSPSVIGAVFNRENFWDGRASADFNGADPLGRYSVRFEGTGCERRQIDNDAWLVKDASLASQALGPLANDAEMICTGRPIDGTKGLGAKLLERQPLALQQVATDDSVLGVLANPSGRGLICNGAPCTYRQMVASAFGDEVAKDGETVFGRIWGQALLAYQATLIPDQTPLDRHLAGDPAALTDFQKTGLEVFRGKAECLRCHAGPVLSDASLWFAQTNGLINEDGGDQGFHNIGVRPTGEDLGRAAVGVNGLPFSVSQSPRDRGAFKTPSLRNVALTAPYFHNGNKATLVDVLAFYVQGGDHQNPELATGIKKLNLTTAEHNALLELLEIGLTDCRVAKSRAPFDHPSLPVPNGPLLPAIGAQGTGPCD